MPFDEKQAYEELIDYVFQQTNGIDLRRLKILITKQKERILTEKLNEKYNFRLNDPKHNSAL